MSYSEATNDTTTSSPAPQGPSDISNSNDAPAVTAPSRSFSDTRKSTPNSQLSVPENITPSRGTIFITLGILVPIMLLFVALFSGTIQP
jgi:hypothetical protein